MGAFVRMSGIMTGVALAGAALTAGAPAARAATAALGNIKVPCSTAALVADINAANSHGGATLLLAGNCTYSITTPMTPADGLPAITAPIGLVGGTNTVISRDVLAPTAFRILDVTAAGALRVSGVTIRNGNTAGFGGGIQNAGTVQLTEVVFTGNNASNGGALANAGGATADVIDTVMDANTTTGVGGGGILNLGTLMLTGSTLSGNTAPINGGGLNTQPSGISRIIQSAFFHNTSGGIGGAISNLGTTSLTGTIVRLNRGTAGGGIATGNNNVTLRVSTVSSNIPDNCSPVNTIPGCVN
jgi:hypothetical protein